MKLLKSIIDEVERDFWKTCKLYGHHVSIFEQLSSRYELTFDINDPDYPIAISVKNYHPNYHL